VFDAGAGLYFMPWIAAMLGAERKLLEYSILYGRIFILALPAWILAYSFQLFFVTAEKPRLGLVVTVCAGLCNIALDMSFYYRLSMGTCGGGSRLGCITGRWRPVSAYLLPAKE
jgi:Na+-driven multidrug efflux pump